MNEDLECLSCGFCWALLRFLEFLTDDSDTDLDVAGWEHVDEGRVETVTVVVDNSEVEDDRELLRLLLEQVVELPPLAFIPPRALARALI